MTKDQLKPFFCYFGGKWRASPKYPVPKHDTIIEPFAGAAGYALRYYRRNVILYDLDPVIFGLWDYLIKTTSSEIMRLPLEVENVNDLHVCQEAKHLIGFNLNKASVAPCNLPSKWMRVGGTIGEFWGEKRRERIAYQVDKIKHWEVYCKSYEDIGCPKGTWFIDPPYQGDSGRLYKFNRIDYNYLARWCKTRKGQVLVCESYGANWLPFQELAKCKSLEGPKGKSVSYEVLWAKEK